MRLVLLLIVFIATVITATSSSVFAYSIAEGEKVKLRRGADLFINYCSGCHSLRYMRYEQLDHLLSEASVVEGTAPQAVPRNNLKLFQMKNDDTINVSMPSQDARRWFGLVPPDLSLIAREKSPAWIMLYMKSFYSDPSRPLGSNNQLVPKVSMPNVLFPLSGRVIALREKRGSNILSLQQVTQGEMSPGEFDLALQDLVSFLVYVAEPKRNTRYLLGMGVCIFLFVFLIVAWKLKRWYWTKLI